VKLPELYKSVIIGHHIEGYSLEEIAFRLGCTSAAIRQRHKRAIELLRKMLGVSRVVNPAKKLKKHK
jgi:RNA polymerase sigma factor (sigma-70 family)